MTTADDRLLKLLGSRARAREAEAEALARAPDAGDEATVERALAALHVARVDAPQARRATPARRPGIRARAWVAAILPVAAAVAFFVSSPWRSHAAAPLGEYVFDVQGRVETERAEADVKLTALEARDGSLQTVTVRPRTAAAAPLAAQVLVVRGEAFERLAVPSESSDLGAFRFDVPGDALRGASEVRIVLAPAAKLDEAVRAASVTRAPSPDDAVILRVPVVAPGPVTEKK